MYHLSFSISEVPRTLPNRSFFISSFLLTLSSGFTKVLTLYLITSSFSYLESVWFTYFISPFKKESDWLLRLSLVSEVSWFFRTLIVCCSYSYRWKGVNFLSVAFRMLMEGTLRKGVCIRVALMRLSFSSSLFC